MVGLPLKFGPGRVVKMLINPEKMRASGCFVLGMILVLRGNSFLGSLLELFGFLNLFLYVPFSCRDTVGVWNFDSPSRGVVVPPPHMLCLWDSLVSGFLRGACASDFQCCPLILILTCCRLASIWCRNLFPFATMALKNMPFVGNLMGTVKK